MRSMKKLSVLVAVFALCAISAANASAAPKFTASATGTLTGSALETQVFTTAGGTVECTGATTTGTIAATESTEQEATVAYSGCKAFGIVSVHISNATYLFTANGSVHIQSPITITVTKTIFTAECTMTVPAQTVGTVDYVNTNGMLNVNPTVTGIEYTSTGSPCGSAGTHFDGTYSGSNTVSRVGGGTISWDKE